MRGALAVLLLGLALPACGSKESITVSVRVESTALAVRSAALGAALEGSCALVFALGDYSGGGGTATLESLEAVGTGLAVGPLLTEPALEPVTLSPGQERRFPVALRRTALLTDPERDALCAGPVAIHGSFTDTLSGQSSTPFRGEAVSVAGCP